MSINVASFLNNFTAKIEKATKEYKSPYKSSVVIPDNIFAQAKEIVEKYNVEKKENENNVESNNDKTIGGLKYFEVANMSTSDFLKYAYGNKANFGFDSEKKDDSGVELPAIVMFGGHTVSTAGKSFMQVVTKFKGKYPYKSEEEIAAKLILKYDPNASKTGNSVNISA